jgi:hypothetical protein
MSEKEKAKIIRKIDLTKDFGTILYLIEIPDNHIEDWYITCVSSNPYFVHPPWVSLKEEAVYVKKGYGAGWYTRVLIADETRQPILVEHIDNINPKDPMHPLAVSLKEAFKRGLMQ